MREAISHWKMRALGAILGTVSVLRAGSHELYVLTACPQSVVGFVS